MTTEDCSNDAENSVLPLQFLKYIKIERSFLLFTVFV